MKTTNAIFLSVIMLISGCGNPLAEFDVNATKKQPNELALAESADDATVDAHQTEDQQTDSSSEDGAKKRGKDDIDEGLIIALAFLPGFTFVSGALLSGREADKQQNAERGTMYLTLKQTPLERATSLSEAVDSNLVRLTDILAELKAGGRLRNFREINGYSDVRKTLEKAKNNGFRELQNFIRRKNADSNHQYTKSFDSKGIGQLVEAQRVAEIWINQYEQGQNNQRQNANGGARVGR